MSGAAGAGAGVRDFTTIASVVRTVEATEARSQRAAADLGRIDSDTGGDHIAVFFLRGVEAVAGDLEPRT